MSYEGFFGRRTNKTILTIISLFVGVFALTIIFISPITKYLIERYDEKYTGRQITLDWAYVNPLTGYFYFRNIEIHEFKKDTLFFSAKSVSVNFALLKLFSKTYEISDLTVDYPKGVVIQNRKALNFDDLIDKFSPGKTIATKPRSKFNILRIKINHGEFYYHEKVIPINYILKDLTLESSGVRYNTDTVACIFSFLSPDEKGSMRGTLSINTSTLNYRFATTVKDFDLEIIRQYLWELINYGMFSAQLDANVRGSGNFKSPESVDVKGRLSFKNFHLGKTKTNDYVAFDKLIVIMNHVNPQQRQFLFDSITLIHPYLKYEKFDSLDNIERLFGKNGSNITDITGQEGRFNLIIEIGRYLKKLSLNFFQSPYNINHLSVTDGNLRFSDYSLSEQFTIGASPFAVRADSINKRTKRIKVSITSGLVPYGSTIVKLRINPRDSCDFDMNYAFTKIPVSTFNPYLVSFSSFPLDRGTLELNGQWNVRNGKIKSINHLLILEPRLAKRVKNKDVRWIPLPLIMTFVRERGNVIDYDVPISGNLKNPRFHLRDVLLDLVKNIFIKPVTVPYGLSVKIAENEIDNTLFIKWEIGQHQLGHQQKGFVKKLARFLKNDEKAFLKIQPTSYMLAEKEHILFYEAKKKYWLLQHGKSDLQFTEDDSAQVNKMSVREPFFKAGGRRIGAADTVLFTIQDKCYNYVGKALVDVKYSRLIKSRESRFREFFVDNGTEKQLTILDNENGVPRNGFSQYKLEFLGDVPPSLLKAYQDMRELNSEYPRDKYFERR